MIYLLAVVGALTIGILLWKAFGTRTVSAATSQRGTIAPDDDPDFLRGLDEKRNKDTGEDGKTPPPAG